MNHVGKGGAALALLDLIREIKTNHSYIDPIIITGSNNELNKALTLIGVENYSAPFKNFLSTYKRPAFLWRLFLIIRYRLFRSKAIKKIENLIDFQDVDIIHTNLNRIDIGYYFANKYNIPHFWHIREDVDKSFKLIQVFPTYNPIIEDNKSNFVVISNSVKKAWERKGLFGKKINLVYDGIDANNFNDIQVIKKHDKLSFVFVGGFHVNKGQELFINALGKLPSTIKECIIVDFYGDFPRNERIRLNKLTKKLGLVNACHIFEYDPDIYKKLSKYHIGVNCSKAEGFGRITVEYMMAGLCPFISTGGANMEIVDDKVNGIFFDRNSELDICNKIINLFNNRSIIEELAFTAKETALRKFSMRTHANNICELYKKII